MVGSAFNYAREIFFKWELFYGDSSVFLNLCFFGLAPFLLYTSSMPDNSTNVQALASGMYWCRKETGLSVKANKPMLYPRTTVSEAIPG